MSAIVVRPLTPRQREIVVHLVAGLKYAQIANELGISHETVKVHVARIAHRLPGEGGPLRLILRHASDLLARG